MLQFFTCMLNSVNYEWKCLTCYLKMVKLIDTDGNADELELIRYFAEEWTCHEENEHHLA